MKNITANEMGFGKHVVGPGETVKNCDLEPEALFWFIRHGCEDDEAKPKATKTKASKKKTTKKIFGG
jgi:hypothetical protein